MILKGFGFSGYRSFGDELTKIIPLRKVNLIIGKNNTGKSNIINFLKNRYPALTKKISTHNYGQAEKNTPTNSLDKHISNKPAETRIAYPILSHEIDDYIDTITIPENNRYPVTESIKKILESDQFSDNKGDIWFTYNIIEGNKNPTLEIDNNAIKGILNYTQWRILWSALTNKSGGDIDTHWIPDVIKLIVIPPSTVPQIEVIPAIRKIGISGSEATDFSGEGIIERLAKIQNPPLIEQADKKKFNAINLFVQEVLENKSAEIEIPYERDMILIHMDNKTLPLESLGTGVHEVVILAAAATLLENSVLCIEEPELHLHPLLQKKLVKYLSDSTNNQYFFTTHSAHLLDAVESEVFHVIQEDGESLVTAIASTKERSNICSDLGYKASDILQANCIIWVEGPSDRIYLNYWIAKKDSKLIEGVHYSIMFYGGRLFSHLTANDDDELDSKIEDFISIRKLNRNSIIMFDSDKNSPNSRLNTTKQRLKKEFDSGPGFSWVTKGREVENYLDHDKLEKSIFTVHPTASCIVKKGTWENLLNYKSKTSKNDKKANKVKVARDYIKRNKADFSALDLNKRITDLCNFITSVNKS